MAAIVILAIIFIGIVGIAAIIIAVLYNRLVRLRNTAESSWSDIDVQLKKRYNLVPNLVETVKAYAKHEREVFTKVTEARNAAMQAGSPEEAGPKENMFKATLKSLFAVAEAYPELKANDNFLRLQGQFQELETSIESARRYYNAVVRDYNTMTESVPTNIIASMFGFKRKAFFELESAEERKPVKGDFSDMYE
jgi:LemA protein